MSTAQAEWRMSSWSSNGTNCVEVFHDLAALRDSKHPTGAVLRVDVRGLVVSVRQPSRR